MKYYLHDSNSFNDEKITELYINFGYEGLGLFYTLLERLAQQEKPIKTDVLKHQLKVGKRLGKIWNFMESIDLISSNNGETFNKQLLNFSEKYQIKKQKNAKRISEWRSNQVDAENVTCNESVRNTPKVKESKVKESKVIYSDEIKNFTHSILKHFPIEPKNINDWYDITDKLVRIDKFNFDSIKLIVETFTADGNFWKPNFQTYTKLRKLNKDKIRFAEYFKNTLIAEKNGINKGNNTKQQGATLGEIQETFNKHFNS